ncbi:MAG: hypothetical protein ACLVKA_04295 [Collinsella aerofaciens]
MDVPESPLSSRVIRWVDQVGDTVKYTITYKNTEDAPATVTVVDVLPKGLTYNEGTASDRRV